MTGARVLLAHGNADCLTIYGSVLAFDGFVVESVGTIAAALTSLASAHFDVVVTDLYIAGSEDQCLIRVLRASPRFAYLPVVVLTGWTTPLHRALAFDHGAECFLPLPVKPRELSAIIADITGTARSTDASILPTPTSPARQLSNGI
jgi:CheY-like chemotaxis protein